MDNMKKGIRCNETRFDNREGRDRIRYEFLSDDGITPSVCTVHLGDIDTVTGEPVTSITYFSEYHRFRDAQVRKNLKAERPERSAEEIALRKQKREAFVRTFRERWGYTPSKDDVLYFMEEQEPERWNLSVSVLVNEEGKDHTFQHKELSVPAEMDENVSVGLQALREVAASLTGRRAEVYDVMMARANGEQDRVKFVDLARKWGVSPKQITKDQEKIMDMVRRRAEELRREEVW